MDQRLNCEFQKVVSIEKLRTFHVYKEYLHDKRSELYNTVPVPEDAVFRVLQELQACENGFLVESATLLEVMQNLGHMETVEKHSNLVEEAKMREVKQDAHQDILSKLSQIAKKYNASIARKTVHMSERSMNSLKKKIDSLVSRFSDCEDELFTRMEVSQRANTIMDYSNIMRAIGAL